MPYLILLFGILLGLYGLYRFFMAANTRQIAALFGIAILLSICVAMFYLAVTGRLVAALGILAVIIPMALSWRREHMQAGNAQENKNQTEPERESRPDNDNPWWEQPTSSRAGTMTRKEAFEVLGLSDSASQEEIREAYKNLIKKVKAAASNFGGSL